MKGSSAHDMHANGAVAAHKILSADISYALKTLYVESQSAEHEDHIHDKPASSVHIDRKLLHVFKSRDAPCVLSDAEQHLGLCELAVLFAAPCVQLCHSE